MTQRNTSPKTYIKWTWAEAERIALWAVEHRHRTDPRLPGWASYIKEAMRATLPPERWRTLKQVKTLNRVLDAIGELHEARRERPMKLDKQTIQAIVDGLAAHKLQIVRQDDLDDLK